MDSPSDISPENAMIFLQQFSQLMFLQSLAAAAASSTAAAENPLTAPTSMNSSMFDFAKSILHSSPIANEVPLTSSVLPPISPQGNAAAADMSDPLRAISDLLSSHQTLKSELSSSQTSSTSSQEEVSTFKMYNNFCLDLSTPSPSASRQYKVHVNRESSKPLQDWMDSHLADPYPSQADVQLLSKQTGFTFKQIRNWFTNSRRRYEQQCGRNSLPWIKKDAPRVCRKISSQSSTEGSESC